jgi:hypothetical protein
MAPVDWLAGWLPLMLTLIGLVVFTADPAMKS